MLGAPFKPYFGLSGTRDSTGTSFSMLKCGGFQLKLSFLNRIVIPTGAYPDFLLRGSTKSHVCGFE
jgi:hypothetical protein